MKKLILSDGTVFEGKSFGAEVDTDGEVVFNTGMVGYPESLTDPSYRGQIIVFTYPLIGNYGVPDTDALNAWGFSQNLESEEIQVRGVICAQASEDFSHCDAKKSLGDWLKEKGIPGITGIDTRALTKKLREHGVMLGRLVAGDEGQASGQKSHLRAMRGDYGGQAVGSGQIEDPNKRNLVAEVSCGEVVSYAPRQARGDNDGQAHHDNSTVALSLPKGNNISIIAYDCGMKRNIIRSFLKRGVTVHRVPWNYDLSKSTLTYDAVFFSNGPGDPKMCGETIEQIRWVLGKDIPIFGICLGNQLLALAIGGDTYKLKYGHRGANQPCTEEGTQRCIITSQNHGFAVAEDLPKGWKVWWRNANDGTVEGIRHESGKFLSIQFHPEATPGPEDAGYLFDEFLGMVRSGEK